MQTVRSGSSRKTPWKPRSQLARCDRTTPFGRPVLPLVKKMTWGSVSTRRGSTIGDGGSGRCCASRAKIAVDGRACSCRCPSRRLAARPRPRRQEFARPAAARCGRSRRASPGAPRRRHAPGRRSRSVPRASFATSPASSAESRALRGAKTAPRRASATKSGMTSIAVSIQPSTRSPWPMPSSRRRARARRSASRSSSAIGALVRADRDRRPVRDAVAAARRMMSATSNRRPSACIPTLALSSGF